MIFQLKSRETILGEKLHTGQVFIIELNHKNKNTTLINELCACKPKLEILLVNIFSGLSKIMINLQAPFTHIEVIHCYNKQDRVNIGNIH